YESIETNHMNEGHAAFLTLELLREQGWNTRQVKSSCVFTTHTPVPAGHDHFDYSLIHKVITGGELPEHIGHLATYNGDLSLTKLASNLSRYINSVAEKHAEVTKNMEVFKGMDIHHITNGIHGRTWTSKSFQKLFDQYLPGWDLDPDRLACAQEIPDDEILSAHAQEKKRLIDYVNGSLAKQGSIPNFKDDLLTIGFARRATAYKRADLIFSDLERLVSVCDGKVQFVFAGKAHPKDNVGKNLIQNIVQKSKELSGKVNIAYLENYNMDLGAMLTSGVDVWLNNPQRPHEASGTSGMKATHNGVPNYSVLDGWWIEGHEEGVTGWAIGPDPLECDLSADTSKMDVEDLYSKLGNIIIPMFYDDKASWVKVMKNAIAKNASFFNTTRMVKEYKEKAYHL
ncbi:alpha-glucan phosphorylase, partial [Candidatus Woesearchaeota archaeon CG11_big_fil_rev_8_21_14_0_20_43_8]